MTNQNANADSLNTVDVAETHIISKPQNPARQTAIAMTVTCVHFQLLQEILPFSVLLVFRGTGSIQRVTNAKSLFTTAAAEMPTDSRRLKNAKPDALVVLLLLNLSLVRVLSSRRLVLAERLFRASSTIRPPVSVRLLLGEAAAETVITTKQ
ncbi:hypothetical protein DPMN_101923 [Dreissena polymorpha]|uniref:Uncharacterized protein n=1 Tax=Dreissena polymorpha TaxID=45954 RepID=A0A9D4LIB8_DREPO|nr:hypothetical protein DPMN_101923 [Dreissena polymorpha]